MDRNATDDGDGWRKRPTTTIADERQHGIYVIATTLRTTSHALDVASALAREHDQGVAVLVPSPVRLTISSARAGVHNLPVELPEVPGRATLETVRSLVADEHRLADVRVTDARDARGFANVLPPSATVILAGPIHHFLETREQRLARTLTSLGYDVIFLPCPDE
jgi:hypothetical protein